jgi:hypothetical protein
MSSQFGILNVISSTKLWTAPSKEQFLPQFFKALCDQYSSSPTARRVFPVQVFLTSFSYVYYATVKSES